MLDYGNGRTYSIRSDQKSGAPKQQPQKTDALNHQLLRIFGIRSYILKCTMGFRLHALLSDTSFNYSHLSDLSWKLFSNFGGLYGLTQDPASYFVIRLPLRNGHQALQRFKCCLGWALSIC